jgi:hypothetical protein
MTERTSLTTVHFEQAVYGSFAFRDAGYAMLAQSPGCRAEWLADFRAACQKLGERPAGVADAPGLFAARLASGPWAVVGMSPQGCDDRGRPGALAFHALFLSPREYRRAGCDPFALAGALRSDWTAEVTTLSSGVWTIGGAEFESGPPVDARAAPIVAALVKGRRVIVESPGPIDDLAREVWRSLPLRVRRRATVATWAFANGPRFDLVAVPRLVGVAVDDSYVDPASCEPPNEPTSGGTGGLPTSATLLRVVVALGLLAALTVAGLRLSRRASRPVDHAPPSRAVPFVPPAPIAAGAPARAAFPGAPGEATPAERRRVAEVLEDLADRCGVTVPPGMAGDPAALMEALARDLRYRGPFLSDAERAGLAGEPGHDGTLALAWDALARRFAADRPLPDPDTLRAGSIRSQLGLLAWSFHMDTLSVGDPAGPRPSDTEVAQALAQALAVDVSLRPIALADRHPALASYQAFLAKLPRR